MNAALIEATEANFSGETTLPPKYVETGDPVSKTWTAKEFEAGPKIKTGIWECTVGAMKVGGYPTDEVFTVTSGKIEMINEDGSVIHIGPGQSALIPKGWKGVFNVVEHARKCFVTAGD
ncbi:MAG: cupin domain-containing protein [Pseudomonadota bacterium]